MLGKLTETEVETRHAALGDGWEVVGGSVLRRRFQFKRYGDAVMFANFCAFEAERVNHHPDVQFGWGYCEVALTSHDAGGLTARDFDFATVVNGAILKSGMRAARPWGGPIA